MIKTSKRLNLKTNYLCFRLYILGTKNNIPWKNINSTRGVSKAVTFDGIYRAMAPEIIDKLKQI